VNAHAVCVLTQAKHRHQHERLELAKRIIGLRSISSTLHAHNVEENHGGVKRKIEFV
jgi:hypothetical protein